MAADAPPTHEGDVPLSPELLHRAILTQTSEAVVYADRQGLIRLWNPGAERVYGYAEAEALGQSLDLIIPERFRAAHWRGYERAMTHGTTKLHGQALPTQARRKDGQLIYIEISFTLIRDEAGTVHGSASVARDITERYRREKALKARLAELEKGRE